MLTHAQIEAVEMLLEFTQSEVADKLNVHRETLRAWMNDPEFANTLADRVRENRRTAVRLLSQVCIEACRELRALILSDDDKNKPKLIIEILKAGGLLQEVGLDDGDPIGTLLARLNEDDENTDGTEED